MHGAGCKTPGTQGTIDSPTHAAEASISVDERSGSDGKELA